METNHGCITVRLDPTGMTRAAIWPFHLPAPGTAHQLARWFGSMLQDGNPTMQVEVQKNANPNSNRVAVRSRGTKYGQIVEGSWNVLVNGLNASISGYSAPADRIQALAQDLSTMLSTFVPYQSMERQPVQDPEFSYFASIPKGWLFQGGVNRSRPDGIAMPYFSTSTDTAGIISAGMPVQTWFFNRPAMGGLLGLLGSNASSAFMRADEFCVKTIAPAMKQNAPDLKIISVTNRPDMAEMTVSDWRALGYDTAGLELTAADMITEYTGNDLEMRQSTRVLTQRMVSGVGAVMAGGGWQGRLETYYRAPSDSYPVMEPILRGILDTLQHNPAWHANERNRSDQIAIQHAQASQRDIHNRLNQISQTLSETSNIITGGYWERHANDSRYSEMRQNATMGDQNVTTSSGETYKVPYGYDQYWKDGLGNFYGGSWGASPDYDWEPLKPTGV
ncbi:MAG: hypothetical protein WCP19_08020 [Chloroflexota bacterium]